MLYSKNDILDTSVFLITSAEADNSGFGTGFVIKQDQAGAYLLTCAHVIEELGKEEILAEESPARLVFCGSPDTVDLAVLYVEGLIVAPAFMLRDAGEKGMAFIVKGFGEFDKRTKHFAARSLRGTLPGDKITLESTIHKGNKVTAWDLHIEDAHFSELKPGYSGSPVYSEEKNAVFAVVSHRRGGKYGHAICIGNIRKIWPEMPPLEEVKHENTKAEQAKLAKKAENEQNTDVPAVADAIPATGPIGRSAQTMRRNPKLFFRRLASGKSMVLLFAVLLLTVIHFFIHPFQRLEDFVMDLTIAANQGQISSSGHDSTPFVWLDIDEHAYNAWKRPYITPRNHLLALLRLAVRADAAAVIVDVLLNSRSDLQTDDSLLPLEDQKLYDFLENYSANYCTSGLFPCPRIILISAFQESLNAAGERLGYFEKQRSFLSGAVEKSKDVLWAAAEFDLGRAYVIRRMRLWESICGNEGNMEVVESVGLLTAALLMEKEKTTGEVKGMLQQALRSPETHACSAEFAIAPPPAAKKALELPEGRQNPVKIDLRWSAPYRRIFFTLGWRDNSISETLVPWRGRDELLLEKLPAGYILECIPGRDDRADEPDEPDWEGKVVVIGASFHDSYDHFMTPAGEMPGTLLIINAIHSLLHGGITPSPLWFDLFIAVLLVFLSSWVFLFRGPVSALITFPLTACLLAVIGFWMLRQGVWFDFSFFLLLLSGVLLYYLSDAYRLSEKQLHG
ncbi:MAG: CHASE2 domain-containing protein [Gammaproteobacteria bacterium]|nr:CHASE2 domain-containing protein [Gammaproteobacteria bacterium]